MVKGEKNDQGREGRDVCERVFDVEVGMSLSSGYKARLAINGLAHFHSSLEWECESDTCKQSESMNPIPILGSSLGEPNKPLYLTSGSSIRCVCSCCWDV